MAQWARCTTSPTGETILVNLDQARSLLWNKKGNYTRIAFIGDASSFMEVMQSPEELIRTEE